MDGNDDVWWVEPRAGIRRARRPIRKPHGEIARKLCDDHLSIVPCDLSVRATFLWMLLGLLLLAIPRWPETNHGLRSINSIALRNEASYTKVNATEIAPQIKHDVNLGLRDAQIPGPWIRTTLPVTRRFTATGSSSFTMVLRVEESALVLDAPHSAVRCICEPIHTGESGEEVDPDPTTVSIGWRGLVQS